MALTISIEGKGVIANADALTNDTGGTGTGDWGEDGGGSISLTTDVFLYGSSCIAGAYSNKSGYQYFDIGDGNQLDFDVSGTEEGQHIFMWIHCPTIGLLETKANKGLAIRLGTSLNDYREYLIAGSDDANGWNGGWKCFIIDPTKAGSVSDTGSYDFGSIRYFGIWIDAASLAKGDNIFNDQIAVGFGLRVTGTSTTGWKDIVEYCTDYSNRAWGMFQEREGIYYAYGKTWIGDSTQTSSVSFTDMSRTIQYGTSEYWYSGAWVTSMDVDASGIIIEDASGYPTTFKDGEIVGSDDGRSGSSFIGNSLLKVLFDLYGGNEDTSMTGVYATIFKDITGDIIIDGDIDHQIYGCSFEKCSQFAPTGGAKIRKCKFINTVDIDAALLWNESIDIINCNFIANTIGTGIEMPSAVGTPYTYNALKFSGNTYDVYNSSGSAIEAGLENGSDASNYDPSGDIVTFPLSVTLKITVKDTSGTGIVGARVLLEADTGGDAPHEELVSIVRSGSTATVTHTSHGLSTGNSIIIRGANQQNYNGVFSITKIDDSSYSYTVSGTPDTPATGTITATQSFIHELTITGGIAEESFNYTNSQPYTGVARKASSSPYYRDASFSGSIGSSGIDIPVQMELDE